MNLATSEMKVQNEEPVATRISANERGQLRSKKHKTYTVIQTSYVCMLQPAIYFFYVPWCMVVVGYQINNTSSNNQQQPNTDYKQTNKLLPGLNSPTRVITITNTICMQQFKDINTVLTAHA